MAATAGKNRPSPSLLPVWPIAILAGSLLTATIFATLIYVGDGEPVIQKQSPTKITIGFLQKTVATPPAREVATPPPKPPKRETPSPRKTRPTNHSKRPIATPAPLSPRAKQSQARTAPPKPLENSPKPVPIYRLTALPRFVHKEEPIYPYQLRRLGREATVKLELLIGADGSIRNIRVLKSAGAEFDRAAIEAIRASRFAPGRVNGRAVPVLMRVPVRFRLR